MPHIFADPVECPIIGCSEKFVNTGALGKHLSYRHGIKDEGFRKYIVNKLKESAANGEQIKKTVKDFKKEYEEFKEAYMYPEEEGDIESDRLEESENAKPIVPKPKVLALVDNMDYEKLCSFFLLTNFQIS